MSHTLPCWHVDAFTNRPFGGNPAVVCWLEQAADPGWMQLVATEMNLSETAFVRRLHSGEIGEQANEYELRWFTPTVEIDLCGHATLATAHALWSSGLAPREQPLRFHTRSGWLICTHHEPWIELDFPAGPVQQIDPPQELLDLLGVPALFVGKSPFDYLIEVDSPETVQIVQPDCRRLERLPARGLIVTARGDGEPYHCHSRFFAPAVGVDEDPVCGSAHCALATYWGTELGLTELMAYQASARGGVLRLCWAGDRVVLGGQAVTLIAGQLLLPD